MWRPTTADRVTARLQLAMNPMRTRQRATIDDLRLAIDCMPRATRAAMLEGVRSNEIIVGAYVDGDGVCPMLAAHRAGGRTSFIAFSRAWDRFADGDRGRRRARRATTRELRILSTHLEASLIPDDGPGPDLGLALAEHRELRARRLARATEPSASSSALSGTDELPARPGDRDRARELSKRPGWAWMRPFRRYDDYERALAHLEAAHEASIQAPELAASKG